LIYFYDDLHFIGVILLDSFYPIILKTTCIGWKKMVDLQLVLAFGKIPCLMGSSGLLIILGCLLRLLVELFFSFGLFMNFQFCFVFS